MMDQLLLKAKNIYQDGCVTITLNTHPTKPDYEKDSIKLKNLVKEAEERLYGSFDKRSVWPILENINRVVDQIDFSRGIGSLVLFANKDFADYTHLPVSVTDRVVIDKKFATRDIIRALHQEASYYVLVLNRQQARVIEAFNDKVVRELAGEFPLFNPLQAYNNEEKTHSLGQDNLYEEFFNQVDKALWEAIHDNPLPIVVASDSRNFDHYLKVTDRKDMIVGNISLKGDEDKAHDIIKEAWADVSSLIKMMDESRISEISDAIGAHRFTSGYTEVWKAVEEGRGRTLFVKKGFYQPAFIKGGEVVSTTADSQGLPDYVDDIIDEIIEANLAKGGEIVFIEGDELEKYNNLALITRY